MTPHVCPAAASSRSREANCTSSSTDRADCLESYDTYKSDKQRYTVEVSVKQEKKSF